MEKSLKKAILVIFLVATLFGSTVAFVIVGGLAPTQNSGQGQQGPTTPAQFVVEGYLDAQSAGNLLARGYTLLELHFPEGCCPDLIYNVEALPSELGFQVVVQKIPDKELFFRAESFRLRKSFNATEILQVMLELCDVLFAPPPDCAFKNNFTG